MVETARRPLSVARRILFVLTMVLATWVVIELAAAALHLYANGDAYPKSTLKREMKRVIRGLPGTHPVPVDGAGLAWNADHLEWGDLIEVIHPYLGFVLDRDRNAPPVSELGFIATASPDEPLPRRRPDRLIVGVFGGSFASGVADRIADVLEACPNLDGRPVLMRRIALGGYKQPQQVMALAYLTMLGAEFDLVIEVDGFNEVALPLTENVANDVNPHYPRMWHLRASTVLGPERARAVGRLEVFRDARDRWARLFHDSKLYRSPALALVWQTVDAGLSRRARVEEDVLATDWPADARSTLHGPAWAGDDAPPEVAMALLADHWARGSLLMRSLAEANGARYLHALQPNQYVEGSKPMGAAERTAALTEGDFARAVRLGYPMLRERGQALRAAGVEFVDLTDVYADDERPLYVDDCCHVNTPGYVIVAEAICDAL